MIPQLSVMLGPCAGGAAYSPALTDLIIMVERRSFMFLTGPDVIKALTGELIDIESLGGTEVHMTISGNAHLAAVATLLADATAPRPHPLPKPPTAQVSPWQAVMRAAQLSRWKPRR